MGTLKKRWRPLRDMSLRFSYVFYTLFAFLLSTLVCSLIVNTIAHERSYLMLKYEDRAQHYAIPQDGRYEISYGDSVTYTIFDAMGNVSDAFSVDYGESYPYAVYEDGRRWELSDLVDGTSPTELILIPQYSSSDHAWDLTLGILQSLAIPLCYGVGTIICAFFFFRRKLKTPLTVLSDASSRIAANELDFTIFYDSQDEMGQLCHSFETMRHALEKNNCEMFRQMEERRQLNAAFTHDLRTPLTVLKGHADILLSALPDPSYSREEISKEIQTMSVNIRRLENYAEAMAKLQRLEDVEIRQVQTDSAALLHSIRSTANILCAGKELMWNTAVTLSTWDVDPEIVMEVCENILNNSSRFAKRTISVTVSDSDNTLCFLVSDDGNGFTARALDQTAKPFFKVKENSEDGHLGFGLSICRILCGRHGGELTIANNGRGGALVCATFSMAKDH